MPAAVDQGLNVSQKILYSVIYYLSSVKALPIWNWGAAKCVAEKPRVASPANTAGAERTRFRAEAAAGAFRLGGV